jgi:hypothetical protein
MNTNPKLVCEDFRCGWVGLQSEALTAPDPFNEGCELIACPKCREQTLNAACDEEGCKDFGTMGTPTPEGYRWTCFEHRPKL